MSWNNNEFVAITGIGIVSPAIKSYDEFTVEKFSQFKQEQIVSDIPVPKMMNSRELRRLSKLAKMAVSAADQALGISNITTENMGIGVALSHGSTSYLTEFHDLLYSFGPDNASPTAFSNGVTNAVLSTISTLYKMTSGGITFTGLETAGVDILSYGAEAILDNEYSSFLVGASEEYSPVVEQIYKENGWYTGVTPDYLPVNMSKNTGFPITEGSAFLVLEPYNEKTITRTLALYRPVNDNDSVNPGLIISCAGGGPQDPYEKRILSKLLQKNKSDVVFTSTLFGNCFALSGIFSAVLACACLQKRQNIVPHTKVNAELIPYLDTNTIVNSILITGSSRDGQIAKGYFCLPEKLL